VDKIENISARDVTLAVISEFTRGWNHEILKTHQNYFIDSLGQASKQLVIPQKCRFLKILSFYQDVGVQL
jgi:hypothetical protein